MLLDYLPSWHPFHIDALGIVTLLGAEQVDQAVGRLARTPLTACLPLLGAYKIAGNDIVKPISGFTLYNITDGIMATDLNGWFCRWLLSQDISFTSTTLDITAADPPRRRLLRLGTVFSLALGIVTISPLIILAILMSDWWGLGNALAMLVSVVVRLIVVGQNHAALDRAAQTATETSTAPAKVFVTLPTGELVTVNTSVGIVLECLLTRPKPPNQNVYLCARAVGWLGVGGHVVCLGQASLISQLLTVAVIVGGTVLTAWQAGDDEGEIGHRLSIKRSDHSCPDFRAYAMARLKLSQKEEDSLLAWNLFPQRTNTVWWDTFRQCQANPQGFSRWGELLKAAYTRVQPAAGGHVGKSSV
jgi:hypothetical protein